jgi:hypothetical protein
LSVPEATRGDIATAIVRGAVGSFLVVGAAAGELVNLVLKPPLEKRRAKWMEEVAKCLRKLESQGIDLGTLRNNEAFVDTVMQATEIAQRNYQAEKWDALRNAVSNSVGPRAPAETKRQIFLQYIDRFTVHHLQVLSLVSDPNCWFQKRGKQSPPSPDGSPEDAINGAFPELAAEPALRDAIWNNLQQSGMASRAAPPGIVTPQTTFRAVAPGVPSMPQYISVTAFSKRSTTLGDEFLAFIDSREATA